MKNESAGEFVFLDTNILLHFRPPQEIDWAKAVNAPEATLVVAPIVLRELMLIRLFQHAVPNGIGPDDPTTRSSGLLKQPDKHEGAKPPQGCRQFAVSSQKGTGGA